MTDIRISKSSSFNELFAMALDPSSEPKILADKSNVSFPEFLTESPEIIAHSYDREYIKRETVKTIEALTAEFDRIAKLRLRVKRKARNIAIYFGKSETIAENLMLTIAKRALDALGYSNSQHLIVWHHRDRTIQIAVNGVDLDGKNIRDYLDHRKASSIARQIENDYQLEPSLNRLLEFSVPDSLESIIADTLQGNPTLETWIDRLHEREIEIRFQIHERRQIINGLRFNDRHDSYYGSDIGWSWNTVAKQLTIEGDPIVLARNHNTKELRVIATPSDPDRDFQIALYIALDATQTRPRIDNGIITIERTHSTILAFKSRTGDKIVAARCNEGGAWQPLACNVTPENLNLMAKAIYKNLSSLEILRAKIENNEL